MLNKKPPSPQRRPSTYSEAMASLSSLPYDLLLNISTYLDLRDVLALHLTCRALYDASTTRTVYRKLANDLLRRCRALPLKGFQRLSDLTTEQLIRSVNKATHYETAWRFRAPRPIRLQPHKENGMNSHSNYMDVTPGGPLARRISKEEPKWYKVVSAPPDEEVDWLSPITSSYTLCATKSGKVVCWDVQTDTCLAEWNPGEHWELWKCRVEFEERTVFFTMAKVLSGSYDDERIMEFVLMRLTFSDGPSGESSPQPPEFSHVTNFRTTGVVMNVFLLDPSERLLSAFIWVAANNTIGLYALPDWDRRTYVFIDTGIECVMSSNWSCILYQQHIVIHCEESEAAYQHFYPLSLLQQYTSTLEDEDAAPTISCRLTPPRTLKKKFMFPLYADFTDSEDEPELDLDSQLPPSTAMPTTVEDAQHVSSSSSIIPIINGDTEAIAGPSTQSVGPVSAESSSSSSSSSLSSSTSTSSSSSSSSLIVPAPTSLPDPPNPYPFPPWYPESAHFVRQWWPSLPNVPRVSCTVVLLAAHDQHTHRTRFVLAQHYFRVPLDRRIWENEEDHVHRAAISPLPPPSLKSPSSSSGPIPITTNGIANGSSATVNGERPLDHSANGTSPTNHDSTWIEDVQDDALMHLWYVSTPFEVVRVFDGPEEDDDGGVAERPRPLVAVDFGHAVWIEYVEGPDGEDEDEDGGEGGETSMPIAYNEAGAPEMAVSGTSSGVFLVPQMGMDIEEPSEKPGREMESELDARPASPEVDAKRLRFVTFPPFAEEYDTLVPAYQSRKERAKALADAQSRSEPPPEPLMMKIKCHRSQGCLPPGMVHTLTTPPGLQLGDVETINIDQSQGAVILSDKNGKIWILCYE